MAVVIGREQPWPARLGGEQSPARVAVISVNCNTRLLIAQLLYSLRTRCTPAELAYTVVVDNASRDGSQELLMQFEQAGLCHTILNAEQRYHGPALNQAMNWLAERQRRTPREDGVDYVWILDSDCVVIRPDTLRKATHAVRSSGAALAGQKSSNAWHAEETIGLYSLLFDPARVWRDPIRPFDASGEPSLALQLDCAAAGLRAVDFPFAHEGYVVHRGRSTLAEVYARDERDNALYSWAVDHHRPHFNEEPGAAENWQRLGAEFAAASGGAVDDAAILRACVHASHPE
jgi:glycosyltransferase involved in cell wall biosynthesis